MLGFLIFYYCFSALFSMATVDETDYATKAGAIAAAIFFFICGPIAFPVILGNAVCRIYKKY